MDRAVTSVRDPARVLLRLAAGPVSAEDVSELLTDEYGYYGEFRRLVRAYLPGRVREVMGARDDQGWREGARVGVFVRAFTEEYFPIHEPFEYAGLVAGVPFIRLGWGEEELHEVGEPDGRLLLRAMCAPPEWHADTRLPVLDVLQGYVPAGLLARLPAGGVSREELHARLDGTPYEPAALFADWLWASTGCSFLDVSDDDGIPDDEWCSEVVEWGRGEWPRATALLERIEGFEGWLREAPGTRFAELLDALGLSEARGEGGGDG